MEYITHMNTNDFRKVPALPLTPAERNEVLCALDNHATTLIDSLQAAKKNDETLYHATLHTLDYTANAYLKLASMEEDSRQLCAAFNKKHNSRFAAIVRA